MPKIIKATILASALLAPSTLLFAGPFGLEMGESASEQGCTAVEGVPGFHRCATVKKPHSAFESYVVQSSKQHGVCWIKAIGKDISDNGYGTSTKSKAEELAPLITKSYGVSPEKTAFLLSGALWDDADEFLMSLLKKERVHAYKWEGVSKEGIDSIYLGLQAGGSSTGYLVLEYYGADYQECNEAVKASEGDAF